MVSRERGEGLGHAHSAAEKSIESFDPEDLTGEDCAEVTCDGFGDGFQIQAVCRVAAAST